MQFTNEENKKIFEERICIEEEKERINNRLKELEFEQKKLQNECSHEVVLKFDTHHIHKVGKIYPCICPACKKMMDLGPCVMDIKDTEFKNAKVIDLTDILEYEIILNSAINVVSDNQDYFYKDNASVDTLANKIKSFIK